MFLEFIWYRKLKVHTAYQVSLYSVLRLFCCFLNYILVTMIFRPGTKISWAFFLHYNLDFMLESYNMHEYIMILVRRTLKNTKTSLIFNISTAFFLKNSRTWLFFSFKSVSQLLISCKENPGVCKTFQSPTHCPIIQSS